MRLLVPIRRGCVALFALPLVMTSGCATAWHNAASAVSPLNLVIMQQPQDTTVMAEQNASFSVSVSSADKLAYQWFLQGQPVSGATASTYVLPKAQFSQTGAKVTVSVIDNSVQTASDPAVLTVKPLNPNLALATISSMSYGISPFPVTATSSSSGSISYSITSGPATIAGNVLTVSGIGTVVLTANQAADGNYASASTSTSFNVGQHVQISPITPANQTIAPGTLAFSATVTGGLTNAITWTASGGTFSGSVWNTPTVAGDYTIIARSVDDPTQASITTATVSTPVITTQPVSQAGCSNGTVQLSVGAEYAATYQWFLNGQAISGATSPIYFIAAANATLDNGNYSVQVSNPAGTVSSSPATLSIGSKIDTNPVSVSVQSPQTASFSVAASGRAPFTYQWYTVAPGSATGTKISGATSSSYTTTATTVSESGAGFYVTVSDSCGVPLNSTSATLTVTNVPTPPSVVQQPASVQILPGGSTIFSVQATGSPTLTYQWYRVPAGSNFGSTATGGTPISGATGQTYSLPTSATTVSNDQDAYYVVVTNPYGVAGSLRATLAIGGGITIAQQPATAAIATGAQATFSVTAQSSLPLTYQWYSADPTSSSFRAIPNATSSTYVTAPADVTETGSSYYVIASNGVTASVQSSTASLFVDQSSAASECGWVAAFDALALSGCTYQLTSPTEFQSGQIHWPSLVSSDHLTLSFTMTISDTSSYPADGFAVILADPTLGATTDMQGQLGWGLGAAGIPGLAITFDDFYNGASYFPDGQPGDPQVPYVGVTRSEMPLFENPFYMENSSVPALAIPGQSVSHDYVISISGKQMNVTMDGTQVLSGSVDVPSVAYLLITAGTGAFYERAVVSNLKTTVQ